MSEQEGAKITEMDAADLVGRLVVNSHGAEFVVTRLSFDAGTASVLIWIEPLVDSPEDFKGLEDLSAGESGLHSLNGWSIHQKLKGRS